MSEVQKSWEQVRSLLEEIANIVQSLSEEDMAELETVMETWMRDNPVYSEDVVDAEIVQ